MPSAAQLAARLWNPDISALSVQNAWTIRQRKGVACLYTQDKHFRSSLSWALRRAQLHQLSFNISEALLYIITCAQMAQIRYKY